MPVIKYVAFYTFTVNRSTRTPWKSKYPTTEIYIFITGAVDIHNNPIQAEYSGQKVIKFPFWKRKIQTEVLHQTPFRLSDVKLRSLSIYPDHEAHKIHPREKNYS